jgi:hypothetical protein
MREFLEISMIARHPASEIAPVLGRWSDTGRESLCEEWKSAREGSCRDMFPHFDLKKLC